MAVSTDYRFTMTTTETGLSIEGSSSAFVIHDSFDESGTLNASSTPPATKVLSKTISLVAGAYTIDLTTETGINGAALAGTGLRVQMIRIKNLGSNTMTFTNGASNGIALACGTITVPAGGITQIFLNDAAPDIAAGDRAIDVAGTLVEQFELSLLLG